MEIVYNWNRKSNGIFKYSTFWTIQIRIICFNCVLTLACPTDLTQGEIKCIQETAQPCGIIEQSKNRFSND